MENCTLDCMPRFEYLYFQFFTKKRKIYYNIIDIILLLFEYILFREKYNVLEQVYNII